MDETKVAILLVEDDEVDVINVKRAFNKNGITNPLYIAKNGEEALDMLRGNKKIYPSPKIALVDINMPKMNGIEFLKEIRADKGLKDLAVFILTTSNEDKDKLAAYSHNVAGYILKPLSSEYFINAIKTLNDFWGICEFPEEN